MGTRLEARTKAAMTQWLASGEPDTLVTVTLKQAILNEEGSLTPLTDEDCQRTCWLLRDRVSKALLGNVRYRSGERLVFVPSIEGRDGSKRRHIHINLRRPAGTDEQHVWLAFQKVGRKLHWVHREFDVRSIRPGTASCVVKYCLKEGLDAFCPEGASL